MNITRILSVPALLLLAGQAIASDNVQSTRLYLTRPEIGAPDLDATGSVLIRSYDGGDRERFDVRAHKITIKATVELWIDDGTGTMAFVANLVGNKGKKYSVDTQKGEALPFGLTLAELAGRPLELRIMDEIQLQSVVPTFVDDAKHKFAKEQLDVAPGSPAKGCQGDIKIKANDQRGLQYFRLKAKDLGWQSFTYYLWVENDQGEMQFFAPLEQYALRRGRVLRSTRAGGALPFGALYLDDLVGRKIEVRDQNDVTYLEENIPPLK
ncbi:MAG TPA: hypothetical protein VFY71_08540 [Planctomycetota bacterium]|nr:hypothetical protein [Planctomycetota bacterium]